MKSIFADSKRTDVQLTEKVSHVSPAQKSELNLAAQFGDAREDSSDETFIVFVLSTPSRLPLSDCFIACIFGVGILNSSLYRGHETDGR